MWVCEYELVDTVCVCVWPWGASCLVPGFVSLFSVRVWVGVGMSCKQCVGWCGREL